MRTFYNYIFCGLLILFLNSCEKEESLTETEFRHQVENLWHSYTGKFPEEHIESAYFALYYPHNGVEDSVFFTYGEAMPGIKANVNDQLYLASSGKMLCATVVLQLMEEGKLSLNDKIADYLSPSIMEGLHVYNGKDYSYEITIKHLLEHSSGISDFIFDETNGSPPFIDLLISNNLETIWTPEETIDFYKKYQTPVAKPGKRHWYTDTGYNLLGLIIENVTEKKLAEVYRERIFEAYGLSQSFMPFYETPVENTGGGIWANTYFYDKNTGINWGEVDHPNVFSFEFGGGNWISTLSDIHKFQKNQINCNLFRSCDTRNQMFSERWPAWQLFFGETWYGYGIFIRDGKHGYMYGHGGANNTWIMYIPRYKAYFTVVLNQVHTNELQSLNMLDDIANLLKKFIVLK